MKRSNSLIFLTFTLSLWTASTMAQTNITSTEVRTATVNTSATNLPLRPLTKEIPAKFRAPEFRIPIVPQVNTNMPPRPGRIDLTGLTIEQRLELVRREYARQHGIDPQSKELDRLFPRASAGRTFSPEQLEKIQAFQKECDLDGDGFLTTSELKAAQKKRAAEVRNRNKQENTK